MNSLHCHHCGAIRFAKSGRKPLSDFKAAPGTRHHALLNSNEAPLGPDVTIIQSTISKIDEHMAELDAEVERVHERMRELQEERALFSDYRHQNHAVLSPVRRIPPEVLGEIVSWTPRRGRRKTRMKDSPWLFTHVSQYWRAVAVSHSKLWSLVAIKYQPETDPSAYPLAMAETQLARAKKLKIQFSGCQTSNAGLQTEMFRYLSKHASRWETQPCANFLFVSYAERPPGSCPVALSSVAQMGPRGKPGRSGFNRFLEVCSFPRGRGRLEQTPLRPGFSPIAAAYPLSPRRPVGDTRRPTEAGFQPRRGWHLCQLGRQPGAGIR
ncbi:hypothetical protein DFH06DRAFT_187089 [Mycena polygramma]|nr:hypothetical protein DFH06DRAFT_187089 [Mycena polygramma]